MDAVSETSGEAARRPILHEFAVEQLPLIVIVLAFGVAAGYWQHGFIPNGEIAWPVAGVRVPDWHLVWMGFWTGYTMAVVGQGAGIFALPYQMSVLQFTGAGVTPTSQLITFLNPFGALFGFRRTRQWNLDLAVWICLGGVLGGLIGPLVRITLLSDVKPFTFTLGIALAVAGAHLCYGAYRGFRNRNETEGLEARFRSEARNRRAAGLSPSGLPGDVGIHTLQRARGHVLIGFWGEEWRIGSVFMFCIGAGAGVISTALGVGGGFLVVPLLAAVYGLPMYVLVAATIPYVIVLSAVGLFTYGVILPVAGGVVIAPEWAWGFFAAAGGILGSWSGAKTQKFVPESLLKLMLGAITGIAGLLYVINFFHPLPFAM